MLLGAPRVFTIFLDMLEEQLLAPTDIVWKSPKCIRPQINSQIALCCAPGHS